MRGVAHFWALNVALRLQDVLSGSQLAGGRVTLGTIANSDDAGSDGSTEATANPEDQLAQAELVDLVRRTIDELSPDEAGVIRAYYFDGQSMGDIAEVENLSKSWVCRLHAQAIGRLTRRIKNSA